MTSTLATAFTRQIGVEYPLIQAPMAGTSTVALAVAVANSGGLGIVRGRHPGAAGDPRRRGVQSASRPPGPSTSTCSCSSRRRRARPNSTPHWRCSIRSAPNSACRRRRRRPNTARISTSNWQTVIELKVPLVSATFGLMDAAAIERLHAAGSLVIGTATNVAEALAWERNGADFICAQGAEAGGHRGTFIGRGGRQHDRHAWRWCRRWSMRSRCR